MDMLMLSITTFTFGVNYPEFFSWNLGLQIVKHDSIV
jgi:hypothetical protein